MKKILALALAIVLALSTLSLTAFAAEADHGTILDGVVNNADPSATFITAEIDGLQANESVEVKLYSGDTLLATTTWKKEFPIFTRVHNSAPTVHTETAVVENSIIADECVIEGTVINSVIFRGVHVGKGAVIRDSVLFHGTYVEDNAELNCIVTDKDVHVSDNVQLSGNKNMPFYVQKNRKV